MRPFGEVARSRFRVRRRKESTLEFRCPRCEGVFFYSTLDIPPDGVEVSCPACELPFRRRLRQADPTATIKACWLCGSEHLYVRKDLNEYVSDLVVVACFVGSVLLALLASPLLGVLCAALLAFLLFALYGSISGCTVCYVCGSIYRGFPRNLGHGGHMPGLDARFLQKREEWLRKTLRPPSLDGGEAPRHSP